MNIVSIIIFIGLFSSVIQSQGCNQTCETCDNNNPDKCLSCIPEFKRQIQGDQCICQEGYQEDFPNLKCLPICGDGILVDGEDCDDGNYDPFDGCNQCKLGCQDSCQDCQNGQCYECKVNYILDVSIKICQINCLDDLKVGNPLCYNQDCFDHCVLCEFGICKKCDETNGWYLNEFKCEPKCGDGIIVQSLEQCDDENIYPFNYCDQCQLRCPDNCLICSNGICIQCIFGFKLISKIMKCIPFCEYNNLINYYDECVDSLTNKLILLNFNCNINCSQCINGICIKCQIGYLLIDDQCRQICEDGIQFQEEIYNNNLELYQQTCQYSNFICNHECLSCSNGHCELCNVGFNLVNNQCQNICGDSIIVGEEQCEDGNEIQFDGCYNCQFQCQQECINCQFGKCLECQIGYENINFICHEQCNNQIITFNELCDDGNLEPYDGCFNCNYSCDEQCEICTKGLCLKCYDLGWEINQENKKCTTICGDQLIAGDEQCDDGNEIKYDGCYQCQYQCQNECIKCIKGICYECNGPNWILKNNICEYGFQISIIIYVFKNVENNVLKIFVEMEYQIFKLKNVMMVIMIQEMVVINVFQKKDLFVIMMKI
ncbi:unnamed protein product [Paramecium primaurelia]|uniref:EGF-like domain-containing protein n=1 Tax=Paramecium primaurelia TaxID=5886 RepID=A0A8S1N0J3_PARPR|nr:unnamed protein product [Paramecium primaurelia]